MQLLSVHMQDFRCYIHAAMQPCPGVNLLWGENAAGKTNLLEAIHFGLCGHSFRTNRDEETIRTGAEAAIIRTLVLKKGLEVETAVEIRTGAKKLLLNGKEESQRALPGERSLLLFRPEDLRVVTGLPGERRRFLDGVLSGIIPGYRGTLQRYFRALEQRNALLRRLRDRASKAAGYATWTETFVTAGSEVIALRMEGLRRLAPAVASFYRTLTGRRLTLRYLSTVEIKEGSGGLRESFRERLQALEREELLSGQTLAGPHRDDLLFVVNDKNLRRQGSRGEQRAAVLAAKMAEAQIREEVQKEHLIYLLDDVFSELGDQWRAALLASLEGRQAFVTTTDPAVKAGGCTFRIDAGDIIWEE